MRNKILVFFVFASTLISALGQGSQLPKYTVATLPAASTQPHYIVQVIDGANSTDCATGGGAQNVACVNVAGVWSALGGVPSVAPGSTLTSAIIAAICNGTTPGTVTLPAGVVNFSTTLVVPSYCTIKGQGIGVSRLLASAPTTFSPGAVVNTQQAQNKPTTLDSNIHLADFTLDMNIGSQTVYSKGISLANISYSSIDKVELAGGTLFVTYPPNINDLTLASYQHDLRFDSLHIHDVGLAFSQGDCATITGQHIQMTNSTLGPCADTGLASFGVGAYDYTITNNTFINNVQTCGVATGPTLNNVPAPPNTQFATSNLIVSNNHLFCGTIGNPSYAIGMQFVLGSYVTITGNDIHYVPTSGGSQTSPAIGLESVSDVTVTGNIIDGSKYQGITIIAQNLETTENVMVTGNTIRGTTMQSIYLFNQSATTPGSQLSNIIINGNTIVDPGNGTSGGVGIQLAQNSIGGGQAAYTNVNVENNTILDDQTTHTMAYGVMYQGSPTASVAGNQISGYTTSAYYVSGAPTVATNTNGIQSADIIQATNELSLPGGTSGTTLMGFPNMGSGNFSPMVSAGDAGLVFDVNGANDTGAFDIVAKSATTQTGIKINGAGQYIAYYGVNGHTFNGPIYALSGANISSETHIISGSYVNKITTSPSTSAYFTNSIAGDLVLQSPSYRVIVGGGGTNGIVFDGSGYVTVPIIHSTTGTRYVCVDTNGKLVSQASACSGT
jgi:hypothetical protein